MTTKNGEHVKTPKQIQILKAADKVHVGGAVNAGDIAREIGDDAPGGTNRVNQIIGTLRKRGQWPYTTLSVSGGREIIAFAKPVDTELDVLNECFQRLSALSIDQRIRVFRYLKDRLEPRE
jgi:hypothetical protein